MEVLDFELGLKATGLGRGLPLLLLLMSLWGVPSLLSLAIDELALPCFFILALPEKWAPLDLGDSMMEFSELRMTEFSVLPTTKSVMMGFSCLSVGM